jgi:hypothetical protein
MFLSIVQCNESGSSGAHHTIAELLVSQSQSPPDKLHILSAQ